jgi:hypothetical protein
MHDGFKFDDQSARKNEWIIRLVRNNIQISFAVFREDRPAHCSERTQLPLNEPQPRNWRGFEAYGFLYHLRAADLGIDQIEFWNRSVPGLVWVNTDLFPLSHSERMTFCSRVADETEQAQADLLFCDLGTGLATIATMKRRPWTRSQVHIYGDELCKLYDSTSASLAIYQHGRRQSWPLVLGEFRAALEERRFTPMQLRSGRARILLLVKDDHINRVKDACIQIVRQDKRFTILDSAERAIA